MKILSNTVRVAALLAAALAVRVSQEEGEDDDDID